MPDEVEESSEKRRLETLASPLSRRTLLGGAALAVGAAALAACTNSTNAPAASSGESLLKTIQSRGTLNVTTSLLYPPEFYKDKSGKPAGYDIDILNLLAKDLGVKLNIIDVPDNAANIANVQSGKADIVSAGLVNTPKRSLVLNFTRGYVPYTQVVIVPTSRARRSPPSRPPPPSSAPSSSFPRPRSRRWPRTRLCCRSRPARPTPA